MNRDSQHILGYIGLGLGIVLLCIAVFAAIYAVPYLFWDEYPYQSYAFPLGIVGVVLVTVGIILVAAESRRKTS